MIKYKMNQLSSMFSSTNLNCNQPLNPSKYGEDTFRTWTNSVAKSSNPCKLSTSIQIGLQFFLDNHVCLDGIFKAKADKWKSLVGSFNGDFCEMKHEEKRFEKIMRMVNHG